MTRYLLAVLLVLAGANHALLAQDQADADKKALAGEVELNTQLQQELVQFAKDSQQMKAEFTKLTESPDRSALLKRYQEIVAFDKKATARLKEIIAKEGFPTPKLVGPDGANAAYAIIQNSTFDKEFQKKSLALMEAAAKKGEVSQGLVATLTDALLILDKKKQRFGTQFQITKKGELVPHPIEDEKNVDARRKAMDLPPLAEFKLMLEEQYKDKLPGRK
jgi:signal-transduction protein with cAMP-binding, CBS, and nucleotidyltransferase domain